MLRKVFQLFDSRERWQAFSLLVLMVIGAGLEVLGLGLILPFIGIINDPQLIHENEALTWLYNISGAKSFKQFLLYSSIGLLSVYITKNLFLALVNYLQFSFIFRKQVTLSSRLFRSYLRAPYTFHLQRNSSELIKNFATEITGIFTGVIIPGFIVVAEGLVLLFIIVLLINVEPFVTMLTLSVMGIATFIFYVIFRGQLKRSGEKRVFHSGLRLKWISQGLGSVKLIKLMGRENFFCNAFDHSSTEYARASRLFSTINILPRLYIETLIIFIVLIVILAILMLNGDLKQAVPLLALFAMAALRMMPSITRIFSAIASVRFYRPSLDAVQEDLTLFDNLSMTPDPRRENLKGEYVQKEASIFTQEIDLHNVTFQYPNSGNEAVKNINLTIPKGMSVAFVGPSGSGKTTIVDILLGLLEPNKGEVLVDGKSIKSILGAWQNIIGYIPQSIYLLDDSIRKNIAFGIPEKEIDDHKVNSSIKLAKLNDLVLRLPVGVDTAVGERGVRLSGGEMQRIGIARALYHDPDILVLDEATSALDSITEKEITDTINDLSGGKTVIIIAHRISTVKNCDYLFFIKQGVLQDIGNYNELCSKNREFRKIAGMQSDIS